MSARLFRIDVQICGTAYIKAVNEVEALEKAKTLNNAWIEINPPEQQAGDVAISGRRFTDPDLPDVSLSPVMTCYGVWPGVSLELAEDWVKTEV